MSEVVAKEDIEAKELERKIRSYDIAIEALDRERETVLSGEHPEYKRRCRRLQQTKEERQRNAKDTLQAEFKTLEKLLQLENAAAEKQMEKGMKLAREKLMDQKAKNLEARREGKEEDAAARMNTRSLRSKGTGLNDDGERSTSRRTTSRRGAQSPTSMLLDKGISDQDIDSDFKAIAEAQEQSLPSPNKRQRTDKQS